MKILIDNGHGENTPGKRSPDGTLREYLYAREIADTVVSRLKSLGYDAERIVREYMDVALAERVRRVNEACGKHGKKNVLLISIHCNAYGSDGNWYNARGWSCYTSVGKTRADELANQLYHSAEKHLSAHNRLRRDYSDGDADFEEGFYLLNKTKCPAVLTENLFMDNKEDVDFLLSAEGREAIVATHVDGIVQYISCLQS